MQTQESINKALEEQIKKINETLNEIKEMQKEELILLQKNHAINMKKIDKIHEYNKISDMTNQIFEKRLLGIESAIIKLNDSLNKKKN